MSHNRAVYFRSLVRTTFLFTARFLIGNEKAIAVHTFCVLVLRWSAPKIFSKLVILMIWIFIALVIAIPYSHNKLLYGDVGYCKS